MWHEAPKTGRVLTAEITMLILVRHATFCKALRAGPSLVHHGPTGSGTGLRTRRGATAVAELMRKDLDAFGSFYRHLHRRGAGDFGLRCRVGASGRSPRRSQAPRLNGRYRGGGREARATDVPGLFRDFSS